MTKRSIAFAVLALSAATGLEAQRATAVREAPGVLTLREFTCPTATVDTAAAVLAETWGTIAEELIEEGLLLDYQILKRIWGDQWNLAEYYLATDEEAFDFAFEEMGLRLQVAGLARNRYNSTFPVLCPQQRNSLYGVLPKPD